VRYVLGVDGGGSKIECLAADEQGRLLGYGHGGPVNTNYVPRREAVDSLKRAIDSALAEAGLCGDKIETCCISAPMEPGVIAEAAKACRLGRVTGAAEGETPRWAARFWSQDRIGVTVDAGTGSLARGWALDGREASAGGWGATLGDEGSGYWIGLQAMIAVLQAHDGRMAKTSLTEPVLQHFGMTDVVDMVFRASQGLVKGEGAAQVRVVHDSGRQAGQEEQAVAGMHIRERSGHLSLTRNQVACLCPVVAQVAARGDQRAVEILREAGYELGRLGVAVIRRLGLEKDEFAVVPFGGVFRIGDMVLRSFRENILSTAARAKIVVPQFDPVVGAVLLALDEIRVAIDGGVLERIEQGAMQLHA
jgi:N-acetylglucosamine kinase-like BadF-type ATPase